MSAPLAHRLNTLTTMTAADLRVEWRRVWRGDPPDVTADLLARGIAWKLQARHSPAIAATTRRHLDRLAKLADPVGALTERTGPLKPGTRLIRQWQGRSIIVTATADGFLFGDRRFRSLSEVAREVTGTNWSGPRFFGLVRRKPDKGAASGH